MSDETTTLPHNRTVLSLNKKEILKLPGFTHLNDYLLKELKVFVRDRVHIYTNKKRGYKVGEYLEKYHKVGTAYKPTHESARKRKAPVKKGPPPVPEGYIRTRKGQLIKEKHLHHHKKTLNNPPPPPPPKKNNQKQKPKIIRRTIAETYAEIKDKYPFFARVYEDPHWNPHTGEYEYNHRKKKK